MNIALYPYSVLNPRFGHMDFHSKKLLEITNLRTHLERKRQTELIQKARAIIKDELMQTAIEAAYLIILRQWEPNLSAEALTTGFIKYYNMTLEELERQLTLKNSSDKQYYTSLGDVAKIYKALEPFRSRTADNTLKLVRDLAKTLQSLKTMSSDQIYCACLHVRRVRTENRSIY